MSAVRPVLREVLRLEEDDTPVAARSRRDWIVDSALFLFAAVLAITSGLNSALHGLHGPLLAIDAIGGVVLCLALWWRRHWPLGLGLASLPVLAVSSSAGPAGVIILYTVAAYRRWQLAVLVAAAQVALLPLERAIQPQVTSLTAYYLTGTLGPAVVVAWGMFRRSRRQAQRERARRAEVRLPDLAAVPDTIGRHALRIVQEALTNARKHASSAPVELRLEGAPGHGLAIEVRNPSPVLATGESKIPGTGTGLLGLAERATLSGGHLEHGLDEHGHFRLHAWLPWPK